MITLIAILMFAGAFAAAGFAIYATVAPAAAEDPGRLGRTRRYIGPAAVAAAPRVDLARYGAAGGGTDILARRRLIRA